MQIQPLDYAFASHQPTVKGQIRQQLADFQVDEDLGFELTGEGEHVCLHIRKSGANTEWVSKQIARFAQVKNMDVSYAGMKDRHAVTTQWFSIYMGNKPEPDWSQFTHDEFEVLTITRHAKKIRKGNLKSNRFGLVIRDLEGNIEELEPKLKWIQQYGIPNYFGEQRFGHDNLEQAIAMLKGELKAKTKHLRGLYLSVVRSFLFNQVLSERIQKNIWNQAIDGDVMQLDGTQSVFCLEAVTLEIEQRLVEFDIHPTCSLAGDGNSLLKGEAAQLEQQILQPYESLIESLKDARLKLAHRATRIKVEQLEWELQDANTLHIAFSLESGSYATSVLRELVLV
ncbi:tRNA pseudouridine(13) synthase TruD [Candidatus Albibeggiatoa sp. nov. BB20]|uniref:tRNA pseudouridine(13) synthase TruD n=1 Tax=Candidatus Albibeggiatoa sp. nov. BB20 TaxID=3162723 RepID=UPI0033653935